MMRGMRAASIGFLFAPISTLAYRTLPAHLNGDATSLFTMLRNLGGSIGISLATSLVTTRSQAWQAYLVGDLSPFWQPYNDTLQRMSDALVASGTAPAAIPQTVTGSIYQSPLQQSGILAYLDLFAFSAIMCLAMVPLTFLFSPVKGGGGGSRGD